MLVTVGYSMPALSQEVSCLLDEVSDSTISGTCIGNIFPKLKLTKATAENGVIWEGTVSENELYWTFDIASSSSGGNGQLEVRYDVGWYYLDEYNLSGPSPSISWNMQKKVAPTDKDILILRSALSKLNQGQTWNRNDDRDCQKSESNISLYCALLFATEEYSGKPYHRQPALQVVREIIGENWSERFSGHRLMEFNNHPATNFEDIENLFLEAEATLQEALNL